MFLIKATQVIVSESYRRDYDDIQGKFVSLFYEVTELFENEESLTMSKLKRFLSKYPNLRDPLCNADTIADVMDVIQEQSSFTCCSYLKHTATQFKITSAVEKINDYYKSVDEFCQHELRHHIYMQPFIAAKSINMSNSGIISFKLQWRPDSKTLSDIQSLLRQAFEKQSIYVHIVVITGGSVRVICCAPQFLMTELVRLAQKNRELLVESSVTYLRVGDTIVVDTSDQNEVRICYHRNCVTLDFHHQISLVKDLVLQLTIAIQLNGELKVDLLLNTNMLLLLQITDFLRGPDSQGMVIHCMCLCVDMGHVCFLPTEAEDVMKSMTHSSAVSDGVSDDVIVHNGCQHTQSEPSSSIWQIMAKEAEYILTYKPDGTFLVREMSGKPVTDPSSSSINTHDICVV